MAGKELAFHIVDVFAESKFAGNQLAVVLNAGNLTTSEMQHIAAEFHYSETTFITGKAKSFRIRIFTPKGELPFAGHPTLGTAFVIQQYIIRKNVPRVSLSLKVGEIPVDFNYDSKPPVLWMKQNEPKFGRKFDSGTMSKVLGIDKSEIDTKFPVHEVSTGIPLIMVPLNSLKSLKRCKVDSKAYFELVAKTWAKSILVFSSAPYKKNSDLSVRVFAEYYGIVEDPATGSGNGCLAAYLCKYRYLGSSEVAVSVDQGYEIGRPSKLYLKASETDRIDVSVGGRVFDVAQGSLKAK